MMTIRLSVNMDSVDPNPFQCSSQAVGYRLDHTGRSSVAAPDFFDQLVNRDVDTWALGQCSEKGKFLPVPQDARFPIVADGERVLVGHLPSDFASIISLPMSQFQNS